MAARVGLSTATLALPIADLPNQSIRFRHPRLGRYLNLPSPDGPCLAALISWSAAEWTPLILF